MKLKSTILLSLTACSFAAAANVISIPGVEDGAPVYLSYMGVKILAPVKTDTQEALSKFTIETSDASIVSVYSNIKSLVAHKAGTTTFTITSEDGSISQEFTAIVEPADNTVPTTGWQDGMFWLNEEWFGHTSGSINYIEPDGNIIYRVYEAQNENKAFGATSQYATIYGNKLIVMSKQSWDGGDTRKNDGFTGGRVVVADAETLQHIASFDEIGGDGRACLGVSPEKIYLMTASGVRVMRFNGDEVTLDSENIFNVEGRNASMGNSIKSGNYVLATEVGNQLFVVDAETDAVVKKISLSSIQGVVETMDGTVWCATTNALYPLNMETLELGEAVSIPGSISSSNFGTWRSINLFAAKKSNTLIWGNGTFYRWNIDEVEDPMTLFALYTHSSTMDEVKYGMTYGTPGYDEATDTYMYATTVGYGASAVYNSLHFIDATTGEVKTRKNVEEYFWFPAMPVNPDKYVPEIAAIDPIVINTNESTEYSTEIEVTDRDNLDCEIALSLGEDVVAASTIDEIVTPTLVGNVLTLEALSDGTANLVINAESNGRVSTISVPVTVSSVQSGIEDVNVGKGVISVLERIVYVSNMDGEMVHIYDMSGREVSSFLAEGDSYAVRLSVPAGMYVISANGHSFKTVIR